MALAAIIAAGIASRAVHTGYAVFDKYLGDALYAAMFYAILRLVWLKPSETLIATATMTLMTAIELFQLTLIPSRMLASDSRVTRIAARLLGTEFSFWDLAAYAVGIGCVWLFDRRR